MTFQELTDKIGNNIIYQGTNVDSATQGALLEWLFDRRLSMVSEDSYNTWLRYYRRNLNMNYPIYLDYLKIEAVRSTMDPFVTDLITRDLTGHGTQAKNGSNSRTLQDNITDTENSTRQIEQTGNHSLTEHTITDNTDLRTPNLTTNETNSNTRTDDLETTTANTRTDNLHSTHDNTRTDNLTFEENSTRTDDLTKVIDATRTDNLQTTNGNTRTDNLASTSQTDETGTIGNSGTESYTDNGQTRAMNIIYPEANMGSIPTSIGGFPTDINYADSEADTFTQNSHSGSNSNTETRNLTTQNDTTNTGTVTDSGTGTQTGTVDNDSTERNTGTVDNVNEKTQTGTVTDAAEDTQTGTVTTNETGTQTGTVTDAGTHQTTESGTERSDFDGDIQKTAEDESSSTSEDTNTITRNKTGSTSEDETTTENITDSKHDSENTCGRRESEADIMPRAVAAITGTNAIKWFVKSLLLCFDNYCEI